MRAILEGLAGFDEIGNIGRHGQAATGTVAVRNGNDRQRVPCLEAIISFSDFGRQFGMDFGDGFLQLLQRHVGVGRFLLFLGEHEFLQLDQLIQDAIHRNFPDEFIISIGSPHSRSFCFAGKLKTSAKIIDFHFSRPRSTMSGMIRAQTRFGNSVLGLAPRVVGTVSQAATLARLAAGTERDCEIVEIRLDLIGAAESRWIEQAQAIEARGLPVIVTIRLASEGGRWSQPDEARLPLFETALRHCTAADVEFRSPILPQVSALACRHQRALIVSYHDFDKTPPAAELKLVMAKGANYGTVVKIATLTKTEADVATLRELFKENCSASLCLLGMGPFGPATRAEFPRLGSCLTYGYLDQPIAPGQPAARDLMSRLPSGAV
jgi:3-dehydroquinate dehydratase-1